jgi:hypothetical protein
LIDLRHHFLPEHAEKSGRGDIKNPRVKKWGSSQILGERCNLVGSEIDDETLSDDERFPGSAAKLQEEFAASVDIGDVEAEPFHGANGFLRAQDALFEGLARAVY